MTEEVVVAKVAELMDTLDQVKKYDAIASSLKKFILIDGSAIGLFLVIQTLFEVFEIDNSLSSVVYLAIMFLTLLIPLSGVVLGILFMQKRIKSVKEGEWKPELSKGFSAALKILIDMDWEKTLDDISFGRIGYAVYGLLKTIAYLVVSVSAFEVIWNGLTFILIHRLIFLGIVLWGLFAITLVFIPLRKDLLKRYRELRALDKLIWELRWFSVEFGRAEFQT